jgi:hypothetical protein
MPCQAQLFMDGKAVKPLYLGFADVTIGDYCQRDDACCGLRAVHGIAAHQKSPLGAGVMEFMMSNPV